MVLKKSIRRICLLLVLCLSGLVFSCASPEQPSVSVPEAAQPDSAMPEPSESDASSLSDDADLSSEPESTPVMKTETARCKCETKEEYKEYLVRLLNEKGYHGVYTDQETGELTHVVRTDYNTANIGSVSDCTSPDVESRSDIRLYRTDTDHSFLDVGGELYRFDAVGGYHYAMVLCDVDGNGTDDLVSYFSFGSGIPYIGLSVFDLTTKEGSIVKSANLLKEPSFAFHYDGEHVYAGNRRLDWKDGQYVFTDVGPIEDDTQFPYIPEFLIPDSTPVMKTETARCKCETKEEYIQYLVSLLNEKGYHGVQVDAETGERTHIVRTDYNTANIGSVSDCTSPDVESRSDIRLYMTDTAHYFLDVGGELYRYDTFGGYHYAMALCDVDGNGTDDLVFYHSSGSGIPYIDLSVFDLTAKEGSIVKSANLLKEPSFAFHYDGEHVYAGNRRLDWKDGQYVFTDVGPIEDDTQFPYSPEFLIPDVSGDA